VAHSNQWDVGYSIGKLGVVFKWPTKIGVILGAILVNWVAYLSGPLDWM
jgi:hypothetical protein